MLTWFWDPGFPDTGEELLLSESTYNAVGAEDERGISKWREHIRGKHQHQQQDQQQEHDADADESSSDAVDKPRSSSSSSSDCYDLPCCMSFVRRWTFFKFVPFCPTFLVDVNHQHNTNDLEDNAAGGVGLANETVYM